MTTIAYKDGIMVADSLVWAQGRIEGYCKKILVTERIVCGCTGTLVGMRNFHDFIQGNEYDKEIIKMDEHAFDAIVVDRTTGEVTMYDGCTIPEKYTADFFAFGSGALLAKGAMLMGASATEAVIQATKIDLATGGELQIVKVLKNE